MKKSIILCLLLTLMGSHAVQAQNKAEQLKQIRKIYADAKKRIAENGKKTLDSMSPSPVKTPRW